MAKKRSDEGETAAPPLPPSPPKPPRPFTRLLSRKQLLDVLPGNTTYPTAWTWIQQGILPQAVELGGRLGWKDNEVLDALDRLPRRSPKGSKGRDE